MYKKIISYVILSTVMVLTATASPHGAPGWYGGYNQDDYFNNPSYYSNPPYSRDPTKADDPYEIYGDPNKDGMYAGFEQDGVFVR